MQATKKRKLKLIIGIAAPLLALVIAISVVGASYAWYTANSTAEIPSLNLTSAEVFTLQFKLTAATEDDKYHGQTAFDKDGYLVGEYRAGKKGLTGDAHDSYLLDKPYIFETPLKMDTQGKAVDLRIDFESVYIAVPEYVGDDGVPVPEKVLNNFGVSGDVIGDIKYGFTWYIKDNNGNIVVSPYGVTGADGFNSTAPAGGWSQTPVRLDTQRFTAGGDYIFGLVFSPEQLFWLQFGPEADREKRAQDIYDAQTLAEKVTLAGDAAYPSQVYYSTPGYIGASFSFVVKIDVLKVYGEGEAVS